MERRVLSEVCKKQVEMSENDSSCMRDGLCVKTINASHANKMGEQNNRFVYVHHTLSVFFFDSHLPILCLSRFVGKYEK